MPKNMKRRFMALLILHILAHPCLSQEKSCMAGVGLSSFLHQSAEISMSYRFCSHWSVSTEASLSYKGLARMRSSAELEHDGEFATDEPLPEDKDTHCERVLISYWPAETFKGFSLSAGVQSGSCSGTDIITDIGYTFEIWNGLYLSTGIRIPVLSATRSGNINAQNIRAGINYRF